MLSSVATRTIEALSEQTLNLLKMTAIVTEIIHLIDLIKWELSMTVDLGWLAILQNSILLDLATETTSGKVSNLTHFSEFIVQEFALFLKIILELIAILIIAISLVTTLRKLIRGKQKRFQLVQQEIRLELGISLSLSLEFLLAADIVSTAVSPSWDAIARLAAITGIRTFLNFFLQREVRELQEMNQLMQEKFESEAQTNDRRRSLSDGESK